MPIEVFPGGTGGNITDRADDGAIGGRKRGAAAVHNFLKAKLVLAVLLSAAFLLPALLYAAPRPVPAVSAGALEGRPAADLKGPRTLTILNPVDLTNSHPDPESGAMLRKTLAANPSWRILEGDSTARLLREYNLDPDLPCSEFQCAFNAGNALQTEFVLFGTTTSLPGLHAFTLDLVHVPSSQVIWSRVGEAPKRSGSHGSYKQSRNGLILQGSLSFAVSDLDPAALNLRRRPSMGLLGVMDAGQSTPHSRVVLHRALSHAYGSRVYDLLGPAEMEELAAALDFRSAPDTAASGSMGLAEGGTAETRTKGAGGTGLPIESGNGFRPGGKDMYDLGEKMGVRYLLWTKVENEGSEHKMDLALYDVAGRKLLRHWPAKESSDFNSLLGIEDRFMTVLGNGAPVAQLPDAPGKSGARLFGKFASIGLAVAAGATLGYMAYQDKRIADREYARYKTTSDKGVAAQAKRNVEARDQRARQFGLLGGLSLALGAAVWVF